MKLEGDLGELDLIRHLLEMGRARFTGAIRFEHDGIIKILYFKEGDVLSASTNDRTDSVDEILLRAGKVTRDHVRQALGKRKDNETLGDAMLALGFISKRELVWARRVQVVGILRSIQEWPAGTWQTVQDYLPKREEGTLFSLPQIVLELVVTDPDRGRAEAGIGGPDAVLTKSDDFDQAYRKLALNEDADAVVSRVDGERSAAEIAAGAQLEEFAVYKLLRALTLLGLLRSDKVKEELEVLSAPAVVVLPETPAPEALSPTPPLWAEAEIGNPGLADIHLSDPETPVEPLLAVSLAPEPAIPGAWEERPEVGAVDVVEAPPERGRGGLILAIVAILILLGAGGWAAWRSWSNRQATTAAPPVTTAPLRQVAPQTESVAESEAPPLTATPVTQTLPPPVATAGSPVPATESKAAPVARPAADAQRVRYDALAAEFARSRRGVEYSVQVAIVCETSSVTQALGAGGDVWVVPMDFRGRSCFRVFWGAYESREAAERGMSTVPASLRDSRAAVVRPREILR